ncbi:hypothetical protein [Metapseudomonas sp. CR1201]
MVSFADQAEEVDSILLDTFSDGCGDYHDATGLHVASNIPLIIDHSVVRAGPEGMLITDAVGITWSKTAVPCADVRGGIFFIGAKRYTVEEIVSDDGSLVTAACMEDE